MDYPPELEKAEADLQESIRREQAMRKRFPRWSWTDNLIGLPPSYTFSPPALGRSPSLC